MNCNIVKDLLPLYIDGLASEESKKEIEEHLNSCNSCKTTYDQMTEQLNEVSIIMDVHEVDYLKKIKNRNIKTIMISTISILIPILIIIKLFVIGFPVKYKDIEMDYEVTNNKLFIEFELNNGHDLVFSSKNESIRDENNNIIENIWQNKPKWVLNNPFDDVGNKFTLGAEASNINGENEITNKVVIEFKDKTFIFENGKLVNN